MWILIFVGMILGILVCGTLCVLQCCLKAAAEADICMDRLLQEEGVAECAGVAECKMTEGGILDEIRPENKGDCQ